MTDDRAGDRRDRSPWPWILVAALAVLVVVLLLLTRPWESDSTGTPQNTPPSSPASTSSSPSATPSPTPSPTPTKSQTPQVTINPGDYVGKPADQARSQLRALGMQTTSQTVDNPGDKQEGTVAGISPTGQVDEGSTITLQVYGPAPSSGTPSGNGGGNGNGNGGGNG
ncbi:MAG: PASTA domain-containing protein [Marmoricola sp.]|nr:PASTA domain-containing protein [Marmoricola sp.]